MAAPTPDNLPAEEGPGDLPVEGQASAQADSGKQPIVPGMDPLENLPNVEDLEKRSIIKRIFLVVFVVLVLVGAGTGLVALFNMFFVQEQVIEPPPPPEEPTNIPPDQDTDADGMPDVWELRFEFDVNDPEDARRDADTDRLRNVDEYRLGTDPLKEDTDEDGFSDGREVESGHNPNGSGKLKNIDLTTSAGTDDTSTDDAPPTYELSGRWNGSIIGENIETQQAFFTFRPDGSLTGAFNLKKGKQTITTDMSGTFTYKKSAKEFTASVTGTLMEGRVMDDFDATFEGAVSKDQTEIAGTWSITPKEGTIIKQDRGTFGITEISLSEDSSN